MTAMPPAPLDRRFCVAPMMGWTDRHQRWFLRRISRRALLYTEMLTCQAVLRGDRARLLGHDPAEHPLALQIGGADPGAMARAAACGQDAGFAEININAGCPSDRVQAGRFGACLMAEPETVAACWRAMRRDVDLPVTVKCRIGIDDQDPGPALDRFVGALADAGCRTLIVHARKAWLRGLSPKENRLLPPLDYERVYRLKQDNPGLEVIVNGGIADLDTARAQLRHVDGVMLGRAAYRTPWLLHGVDPLFFGDPPPSASRRQVVAATSGYAAAQQARGVPLKSIARHLPGLFQGQPGARAWRRFLAENAHRPDAGPALLQQAAALTAAPHRAAA